MPSSGGGEKGRGRKEKDWPLLPTGSPPLSFIPLRTSSPYSSLSPLSSARSPFPLHPLPVNLFASLRGSPALPSLQSLSVVEKMLPRSFCSPSPPPTWRRTTFSLPTSASKVHCATCLWELWEPKALICLLPTRRASHSPATSSKAMGVTDGNG